jgi:hypothetical protein
MTVVHIDLSKTPDDPEAGRGYQEIYRSWKRLYDVGESEPGCLTTHEFLDLLGEVVQYLTPRERDFFERKLDGPGHIPAFVQAKTTARLNVILMDRHGFKVKRENGGVGSL